MALFYKPKVWYLMSLDENVLTVCLQHSVITWLCIA